MNPSIGVQLKEAREARSQTLQDVSKATHMRVHYLQALEADDLESMPSNTQARGFLRTYANYLGLDSKAILESLDRQAAPESEAAVEVDRSPQDQGPKENQLLSKEVAPRQAADEETAPRAVVPSEVVSKSEVTKEVAASDAAPAGVAPVEVAPDEAAIEKTSFKEREQKQASQPKKSQPKPGSQEAAFEDVGQRLKKQRQTLGLSLDDVARHTSLRQHYLVALESGDLEALPSPVQGRGMLKNYAVFLGMDPEPLLIRFAQGLQAGLKDRRAPTEAPTKKRRTPLLPARTRRLFSGDVLIGGTVGILLLIFVVWVSIRVFAMQSESIPTTTAPSIVDVLISSPTATLFEGALDGGLSETSTVTPVQAAVAMPLATETPTPAVTGEMPLDSEGTAGVEIYISVHYRTWLRVTVDGEVELEGRVLPGSAYTFSAENQIEILTGNAGAIQVFYNQQDQQLLGEYGQVANVIYTSEGITAPTPTITPTATNTPRVTPTTPVLPGAGTELPPLP